MWLARLDNEELKYTSKNWLYIVKGSAGQIKFSVQSMIQHTIMPKTKLYLIK